MGVWDGVTAVEGARLCALGGDLGDFPDARAYPSSTATMAMTIGELSVLKRMPLRANCMPTL